MRKPIVKEMKPQEIIDKLQRDREEFNALPTSEKIQRNREARIASLLKVGYLSPDEAQGYREQLTELPQNRKDLVVAYFLLGIDSHKDLLPTTEETARRAEVIASFHLSERGALRNGTTIADILTTEEQSRWSSDLSKSHIEANLRRAENFVDAKRKRIKGKLLKLFPILIGASLAENEKQGKEEALDAIPYLRESLKEWGYKGKGQSLNAKEKAAIERAASHYLDLIELAFLNGVGIIRYEEYKSLQDEEGDFKEKFFYRDIYDEALTEWESIYLLFDNAVAEFYAEETATEAINFLRLYYEAILEKETTYFQETLQGTKFNYLLEEKKC